MLEVRSVTKRFGGATVVADVSLSVAKGEIVGLIGPNGAGKTTLFNLIAGSFRPTSGEIRLEGVGHHRGQGRIDASREGLAGPSKSRVRSPR